MNNLMLWIVNAYSRMLNLYPRRFRDEFAVEMRTVFKSSMIDAAEEGVVQVALVCARELIVLPLNILQEFWHEMSKEDANMQIPQLVPLKQGPASWRDSCWAGLPHLLIAAFIGITGGIANTKLATTSGMILLLLLAVGLLATIYYTWRNRWPAWSASWYGYLGLIILLFSTLPYQYWEGVADRIFTGIRFIILLLCLVTVLYWLSRRNPIEGLLMAMPVIILFWFPVMEFVPNPIRAWLTFWLFLLPALTATAVTRLNDIKKAVWLVLGASLLNGLPIAYARTYWNNIPAEHSTPPSFGLMAELFSVPWLASAALALAPILGWGLWSLGRRHGKIGRISAILVVAGMIVNFFGHFSYWWWFSKQTYLNALQIFASYHPSEASSTFLVYAGLAAMLVGALGLAVLIRKQSKLLSAGLILVPLVLPVVARFTTYFGYYVNIAGTSLELVRLSEVYHYLVLFAGAMWLAMSGWTITHLYDQPLPKAIA